MATVACRPCLSAPCCSSLRVRVQHAATLLGWSACIRDSADNVLAVVPWLWRPRHHPLPRFRWARAGGLARLVALMPVPAGNEVTVSYTIEADADPADAADIDLDAETESALFGFAPEHLCLAPAPAADAA